MTRTFKNILCLQKSLKKFVTIKPQEVYDPMCLVKL